MKNQEKKECKTLQISAKVGQFKKHQKLLRLNQNIAIENSNKQKENNNQSMRKRSRMTSSVEPVKVDKVLKRIQKKKDTPQPQTPIKQRRLRQRVISLKVATEEKQLLKTIKNAKSSESQTEQNIDCRSNGQSLKITRERQQQPLSLTIPNGIKEGKGHESQAKCDIQSLVQLKQKIMNKFSENKWSQIDQRNSKLKEKAQMLIEQKPEMKLNLILDLDETLVNSVWENSENRQLLRPYAESCHKNILNNSAANRSKGISSGQVSVLRPHLREFLQSVGEFFKVYVYSHGKKDYVTKLIEKLNVRRDILDISRTFKNEGQVSSSTQKDIRNIFPVKSKHDLENIHKNTVIVDDFIDIWQCETQKNIVPIKRFQPLVEISKKENRSTLTFESKDKTISFSKNQSYYFQDLDYNDHSNNYLNYLSRYLCALASSHYINLFLHPKHSFDIREEMLAGKFSLFNKHNMFLDLLAKEKIYEASKYIVLMTGAQIANQPKEASIALLVPASFHARQKEIIAVKKEHPKIVLVDVKWVIDSFYLNTQLDMNLYSL